METIGKPSRSHQQARETSALDLLPQDPTTVKGIGARRRARNTLSMKVVFYLFLGHCITLFVASEDFLKKPLLVKQMSDNHGNYCKTALFCIKSFGATFWFCDLSPLPTVPLQDPNLPNLRPPIS